ncbi:SDR family oxidoreductase [Ramlibacter sp. AW1]|uniref:SDR family oxidoreductase n=1 Tax=Ramlibacter aurantiacus TaxID=2801330 RepID=A0A936ZNU8_9BURK|nr:SDR family oxidoreductase [Ramlibacter aurantiacus]MBL0419681.1 SDR family oxidoreductase [Ramlibacter aurantiacus]
MDLGIRGRKAIVCASSQGLGYACALALAEEGCEVVINGRQEGKLQAAAQALREATGARITPVAADISTDAGRGALLAACPAPDILVNNNAGPPPGQLADWDHATWIAALENNLLAGALLIREVLPGMRERRFGRVVNITSAMVKQPHAAMGLSTAARAALTAFTRSLAGQAIVDNVTMNNLLPERFDTPRQEFMAQRMMREQGITREQARQQIADTLPARRFGDPAEFGAACAFLCGARSGFMTGQNLQLDGGSYAGLV